MTESSSGGDAESLAATDPAALDRLKRFGGGKLLGEMIGLFIETAPERITAARHGVNAGDAEAVEMALHSLKSSAAQLGAMRMQRLSEQGEQLARTGVIDIVAFIVQDIEDEFPRVQAWLERARQEQN